jgi:hypothetical protein
VVLTDPDEVEAHLIGQDAFGHHIADDLRVVHQEIVLAPGYVTKRIYAQLYLVHVTRNARSP